MAYRFILEVPETLVEDANVVVNAVDDAEVLLARESHGLGFQDPYRDLSIAAHSLRVIDAIYAWYADLGANTPESRVNMQVVLHRGDRLSLYDVTRPQMIAAIRRDQPWVERSIPKIGEHETKHSPGTSLIESNVVPEDRAESSAAISTIPRSEVGTWVKPVTILAADDAKARAGITVAGVPHVLIGVYNLAKPERVYGELFGLQIIGRGNRTQDGGWEFLPAKYDDEQDAQWGTEPDYAFLQNGPLAVALEREGRNLPLERFSEIVEPIRLVVDKTSLYYIRAKVLMRNYNVLDDTRPNAFVFRDPFAYTWAIIGHEEERT